ncbi:hypothetical protein VNO77_05271 [Canavalia gladiata]|uniref:HMA domain-containing protein n=1 Tax=Canavalia gladiata TaxID=3824 RepID=A0AAN9R8I5_CANGL
MVMDKFENKGMCQMFNMPHASVIEAKSSLSVFFLFPLFGQKKKAMLDLSKPIISNSHTLITLRGSKTSGLVSHILKLNVLLSLKKHMVLPYSTCLNSLKTQNPRHYPLNVVELKVEMVCIHEKRLRKCLSKLKGIEKVEVDTNCQKVVVTGYTHKNKILKAVRRGGLKADFWSAQNELLNAYVSANYSFRFNAFNFF